MAAMSDPATSDPFATLRARMESARHVSPVSRPAAPLGDQARVLRGLMQTRQEPTLDVARNAPSSARTVSITSGKGGVGKSVLALNLAIALAQCGSKVCLLDANLGLGNIDLLCSLNGYWNLSHVVTGARQLKDVLLKGPAGIDVVPGASGLADLADCPESARRDILQQVSSLEQSYDFLLIDTGAGIHRGVRYFAAAADHVLLVTTPEPTAVADAYATVKSLVGETDPALELVVNQCRSAGQARDIALRLKQTAHTFLGRDVEMAGCIPRDHAVEESVAARKPFAITHTSSSATLAVLRLARRLQQTHQANPTRGCFFERLSERILRSAHR